MRAGPAPARTRSCAAVASIAPRRSHPEDAGRHHEQLTRVVFLTLAVARGRPASHRTRRRRAARAARPAPAKNDCRLPVRRRTGPAGSTGGPARRSRSTDPAPRPARGRPWSRSYSAGTACIAHHAIDVRAARFDRDDAVAHERRERGSRQERETGGVDSGAYARGRSRVGWASRSAASSAEPSATAPMRGGDGTDQAEPHRVEQVTGDRRDADDLARLDRDQRQQRGGVIIVLSAQEPVVGPRGRRESARRRRNRPARTRGSSRPTVWRILNEARPDRRVTSTL